MGAVIILGAFAMFIALWLIAIAIYWVVLSVSEVLSAKISIHINRITRDEIRKLALGSDTVGETATTALTTSPHFESSSIPLPGELAGRIADVSDEAARHAISKLRSAFNDLAFSERGEDILNVVSDYLTCRELIHTTYSHVPQFRKLVAYAIAQMDGFRATEAFKADPEFAEVAKWYDEISRGAAQPATS